MTKRYFRALLPVLLCLLLASCGNATRKATPASAPNSPAAGVSLPAVSAVPAAPTPVPVENQADPQGWTLTIDDITGDHSFAVLTLTVTAPEETVLDADNYLLRCMPMANVPISGWGMRSIEDDDPADNRISFELEMQMTSAGEAVEGVLYASDLEGVYWTEGHIGEKFFPVTSASWEVPFRLEPGGTVRTCRVDRTVESSRGPVTVGKVEIGPWSVTIEPSGEVVLHGSVEMVHPDVAPLPDSVVLEFRDAAGGTIFTSMSGGWVQDGIWQLTASFRQPIDPADLASVLIDGTAIPLDT